MKTLLGNALRCIFPHALLLQSLFSSAQCLNRWRAEYVGQIHRHCSICSQHSVLFFFSPCTVFCPLFPVQSLPCAQLALLGDKSGLTAMNTDSLLMCYNLFWFAAQHSPVAPSSWCQQWWRWKRESVARSWSMQPVPVFGLYRSNYT